MIESTVVEMARQTNLINLVGNSIELRRESAQEWSGPCPVCQGNDRFHVKADGFFCRRCHPEFGDAIEYMRWLHKDTFTGAVERLTGHTATSTITKLQPTAKQPAQRKVQISITLTPEALAKLDALAKASGTNRSAVVDALIMEK